MFIADIGEASSLAILVESELYHYCFIFGMQFPRVLYDSFLVCFTISIPIKYMFL